MPTSNHVCKRTNGACLPADGCSVRAQLLHSSLCTHYTAWCCAHDAPCHVQRSTHVTRSRFADSIMFLGGTRPLPCLAIHNIKYSQRVWPNCSNKGHQIISCEPSARSCKGMLPEATNCSQASRNLLAPAACDCCCDKLVLSQGQSRTALSTLYH